MKAPGNEEQLVRIPRAQGHLRQMESLLQRSGPCTGWHQERAGCKRELAHLHDGNSLVQGTPEDHLRAELTPGCGVHQRILAHEDRELK